MRLQCGKCVVRDWARSDKESMLQVANNLNIARNLMDVFPHPYTEKDADNWFSFLEQMPEPTHWAIEVQGRAAGGIGVRLGDGIFAKSGQLGYWMGEPWWGQGITTEAVAAVSRHAMSRFGLVRLESPVFAWNAASMRVLEKCGFVREAVRRSSAFKDGRLIDRVLYALILNPPR
jgi:RimJ/RimL family protein N-acetyltransferase